MCKQSVPQNGWSRETLVEITTPGVQFVLAGRYEPTHLAYARNRKPTATSAEIAAQDADANEPFFEERSQ